MEFGPKELKLIERLPLAEQREILKLMQLRDRASSIEGARARYIDFVKYCWDASESDSYIDTAHWRKLGQIFDAMLRGELNRVIINMAPRVGKALSLDTEILTPSGFKTMADIDVGDQVFGADGKPYPVTWKSPVFKERKCWEVETDDGGRVIADEEHEWSLSIERKRRHVFKNRTTAWVADRFLSTSEKRRPALPPQPVLKLKPRHLLVSPYTLGVWLGDGSRRSGEITCHPDHQPHIRGRIHAEGWDTRLQKAKAQRFSILGLPKALRAIGVFERKHVPVQYLLGSEEQRLALLHGLMDTDGNVTKDGKNTFNNKNKDLIDAVVLLVLSLGMKPFVNQRRVIVSGKDHGVHYRVVWIGNGAASIPHKAKRCRSPLKPVMRYIRTNQVCSRDTACIEVGSPDNLFLAGRGLIPTHNSRASSLFLPGYFLGKNPKQAIIQATHTASFSVEWGEKVRDLVDSDHYRDVFPGIALKPDNKAKGHWKTNHGGEYYAVGVGGTMVGRNADLMVIDDPHTEGDGALAAYKPEVFEKTYEWYLAGPRQRLTPRTKLLLIQTRWGLKDLTGRIISRAKEVGQMGEWHVVNFPAIFPDGKWLAAERFPLEYWLGIKTEYPASYWNSVYQQNPTSEEAAMVKREWWKPWEQEKPPECEFILQSWDTAYLKTQRSDFCACTTWGVFSVPNADGRTVKAAILLDSFKERMEFPELKQKAKQLYNEKKPDCLLIEAKAAGAPLAAELRHMGIPVSEFTPSRGNDKIVRVNAVSDIFKSGWIYFMPNRSNQEVIEEFAAFPTGNHDDFVDSGTQAILRFRQGGFIKTSMDYDYDEDDEDRTKRRRGKFY